MDTWSIRKKQSQTNPNKAKSIKAEMNVTSIITVAYENISPIRAPKKQSQIPKRQKPMQTSLPQRIMKETRFWASKKQTQFKPKRTQSWSQIMLNSTIKTRPKSRTEEIEHDCPSRRIHAKRPEMPNCSLIEMNNRKYLTLMVFGTILALTPSGNLHANPKSSDPNPHRTDLKGWKTNTTKQTIELNELVSAGRVIHGELKAIYCRPLSTEAISNLHGCFSSQRLKYIPSKISPLVVTFGKVQCTR